MLRNKLFLFTVLTLGLFSGSYGLVGSVKVADKLAPKNDGAFGVVDSSQALTNITNFNRNLTSADTDVQKALETLDDLIATGGGGGIVAYGSLSTSANSISQSISTTPAKMTIFTTAGSSSNTVVSTVTDQITMSTAATVYVYANFISTGTGSYTLNFSIRVNGAEMSPALTCSDTPSARCTMSGIVSLNSGDVVTVYGYSSTGTQTMFVTDAQFQVSTLGGVSGGSSESGGGGSAVNAAYGAIYLSSGSVFQSNISSTPVKLSIFDENGIAAQTVPDHTTDEIEVSTTSVFNVWAVAVPTATAGEVFDFEAGTLVYYSIRVNGDETSLTCRAFGSSDEICPIQGILSLTEGDVVSYWISASTTGFGTIYYTDAQLVLSAVGGAGGGGGGGSGDIEGVTAGTNMSGGGTSGTVTVNMADPITLSSGTVSTLNVTSIKFPNGTVQVSSAPTSGGGSGDIEAVTAGTNMTGGGTSGTVTLNLADPISISSGSVTTINVSSIKFADGTVQVSSASGSVPGTGDNLGNHIATRTISAGFGIGGTTGTFTGLVTANRIAISTGNEGTLTESSIYVNHPTRLTAINFDNSTDQISLRIGSNANRFNTTQNILTRSVISGYSSYPDASYQDILEITATPPNDDYPYSRIKNKFTAQGGNAIAVYSGIYNPTPSGSGDKYYFIAGSSHPADSPAADIFYLNIKETSADYGMMILPAYDCSALENGGKLTVNSSNQVICDDDEDGVGGGSVDTFDFTFDAGQAKLPGSSSPYISNSTNSASPSIFFDEVSTQSVTYTGVLNQYNGGNLYADIIFTSTATSGTINWAVYTDTRTANISTQDFDTPSFNVAVSTSITLSGTANSLKKATVLLSNTTVTEGDTVTFKLERLAGLNDTSVAFGRVRKLRIYEE